jgi:hypothetical protein
MNVETRSKREGTDINPADRRGHTRYRFAIPINVYRDNGLEIPAMTLEISESGLSAVLAAPLKVGETVDLEPVGGDRAKARVCHNVGRVHGFQFIDLSYEQSTSIKEQCKKLPQYKLNRLGI